VDHHLSTLKNLLVSCVNSHLMDATLLLFLLTRHLLKCISTRAAGQQRTDCRDVRGRSYSMAMPSGQSTSGVGFLNAFSFCCTLQMWQPMAST
uniref:Uncharacterized protein n=1 Tax=Sciurus vulgaris TaxID=55149 RepID=A0A8D2D0S5_SCIVU